MMGAAMVADSCPSSSVTVMVEVVKSSPGVAREAFSPSVPRFPITASYSTFSAPDV